jgi:hypothetical protein
LPYVDDVTISAEEPLLRRVRPGWIIPDHNRGRWRPSKAAFQNSDDGSPMSVHLASVLQAAGLPLTAALAGHDGYGLVSLTAGLVRSLGQIVVRDPLPNDPAHGLVVGNKTESRRKNMMEGCEWVTPQDRPLPPETA